MGKTRLQTTAWHKFDTMRVLCGKTGSLASVHCIISDDSRKRITNWIDDSEWTEASRAMISFSIKTFGTYQMKAWRMSKVEILSLLALGTLWIHSSDVEKKATCKLQRWHTRAVRKHSRQTLAIQSQGTALQYNQSLLSQKQHLYLRTMIQS